MITQLLKQRARCIELMANMNGIESLGDHFGMECQIRDIDKLIKELHKQELEASQALKSVIKGDKDDE